MDLFSIKYNTDKTMLDTSLKCVGYIHGPNLCFVKISTEALPEVSQADFHEI